MEKICTFFCQGLACFYSRRVEFLSLPTAISAPYRIHRKGPHRFRTLSQRSPFRRCTKHRPVVSFFPLSVAITHLKAIVAIAALATVAARIQGTLVHVYLAQASYFWAHTRFLADFRYQRKLQPNFLSWQRKHPLCDLVCPKPMKLGKGFAFKLNRARLYIYCTLPNTGAKGVCAAQTG